MIKYFLLGFVATVIITFAIPFVSLLFIPLGFIFLGALLAETYRRYRNE